jgi:hypothetical protein
MADAESFAPRSLFDLFIQIMLKSLSTKKKVLLELSRTKSFSSISSLIWLSLDFRADVFLFALYRREMRTPETITEMPVIIVPKELKIDPAKMWLIIRKTSDISVKMNFCSDNRQSYSF